MESSIEKLKSDIAWMEKRDARKTYLKAGSKALRLRKEDLQEAYRQLDLETQNIR